MVSIARRESQNLSKGIFRNRRTRIDRFDRSHGLVDKLGRGRRSRASAVDQVEDGKSRRASWIAALKAAGNGATGVPETAAGVATGGESGSGGGGQGLGDGRGEGGGGSGRRCGVVFAADVLAGCV